MTPASIARSTLLAVGLGIAALIVGSVGLSYLVPILGSVIRRVDWAPLRTLLTAVVGHVWALVVLPLLGRLGGRVVTGPSWWIASIAAFSGEGLVYTMGAIMGVVEVGVLRLIMEWVVLGIGIVLTHKAIQRART